MKNWFWIPLAAIAGVIAGSWGPREDLRLFREKSREAATAKKTSDASGFGAFAKMVNIPDMARRRPQRKAQAKPRPGAPTDAAPAVPAAPAVAETPPDGDRQDGRRRPHRMDAADLKVRIDEAAELWRTRVELARTQWKSRLGIAGTQGDAAFDEALRQMNESLTESMEALAGEIERAGKLTPELSLRLMGEASTAMVNAYDALGEAMPPESRGKLAEMPVYEFIDPSVAEPLVGVQDKLDVGFREMRK